MKQKRCQEQVFIQEAIGEVVNLIIFSRPDTPSTTTGNPIWIPHYPLGVYWRSKALE